MGSMVAVLSEAPEVGLNASDVPPTNAILVTPADSIYLAVYCSIQGLTVTLSFRTLQPDGSITLSRYDVQVSGTRISIPNFFPLNYGFIISCVVTANTGATPKRGQVYAQVFIQRGAMSTQPNYPQQLCCGYVTYQTPLFYPYGPVAYSTDGRGMMRSITGTTPALGAEINEVVPTGAMWKLQSIVFSLTASAAVSTRGVVLSLVDSVGSVFAQAVSATPVAASSALFFAFGAGLNNAYLTGTITVQCSLPTDIHLTGGFRIITSTAGLQTGDQYGQVQYLVEEWLQG